ncbi:MAG: hypothetical protein II555_03725 [Bacteroidales bacterium]|nr:hypothetical protein [Bacteroidales bacterium]
MFGILFTSLSRRSFVLRFAIETIHWMLSSHLNFVDVALARQSKRAFSALALRIGRQRCGQSARNKY